MKIMLLLCAAAWASGDSSIPSITPENPRSVAGVSLYDAGNFPAAAAAFAKAAEREPRLAARHYNLGNALFKTGRLGPAIAAYQRAFDLMPRDEDIRFNLDFALRRAGEELIPPGVPPLMFRVFYLLSERELSGLHWLMAWASLLLASLWLLGPRERRKTLTAWTAAAAASWLFFGGWWLARRGLEPGQRGVIVRPTAELRSGPGEGFSVSFTAPEGRRVRILSENGKWLEIGTLKEGAKGWLESEAVEEIQ